MKKVVIIEDNELEVLNKNLMVAFGLTNQLNVDGENKKKAEHISNLLKEALNVLQ